MSTITIDMEYERTHMAFIATTIAQALAYAQDEKHLFVKEPINWGDLSCADVQIVIDRDGDKRYLATVEEAAPHCEKLIAFILAELHKHKFENIDVITEW